MQRMQAPAGAARRRPVAARTFRMQDPGEGHDQNEVGETVPPVPSGNSVVRRNPASRCRCPPPAQKQSAQPLEPKPAACAHLGHFERRCALGRLLSIVCLRRRPHSSTMGRSALPSQLIRRPWLYNSLITVLHHREPDLLTRAPQSTAGGARAWRRWPAPWSCPTCSARPPNGRPSRLPARKPAFPSAATPMAFHRPPRPCQRADLRARWQRGGGLLPC